VFTPFLVFAFMENILLNQVVGIDEVQQAATWQKEKRAGILTGLSGSSKSDFFCCHGQAFG